MAEKDTLKVRSTKAGLAPEELRQKREALIAETYSRILLRAQDLPDGAYVRPLAIISHSQWQMDSCLLACAISVRDSLIRAGRTSLPQITEQQLIQAAKEAGILRPGGTDPNSERVALFLSQQTGLSVRFFNQDEVFSNPQRMGEICVDELRVGNTVVLGYGLGENHKGAGHWVVVSGFHKRSGSELTWETMNPLGGRFQTIDNREMAERLASGNIFGGLGAIYVLDAPKQSGFRVISRRSPTGTNPKFRVKEIRPHQGK